MSKKLSTNETSKTRKSLPAVLSSMPKPKTGGRQNTAEKPPTSAGNVKR